MTGIVARNPAFRRLLEGARRAARTDATILLTGESGSGKNILARAVHEESARRERPFVEVHCANLPADLIEAELFGYDEGAFTGAAHDRVGRLERASGGSLFLDEVQELQPPLQAKILRVIEEKRFERIGSAESRPLDARIVASVGGDPERLVAEGRLREDLYYRLQVVRFDIPPLRERPEDVEPLALRFLAELAVAHGSAARRFSEDARELMGRHGWPGNVRELRHVIESAVILGEGDTIGIQDLPLRMGTGSAAVLRRAADDGWTLARIEDAYIDEVLRRTRGNKSAAARILGIHRKTLHERLRSRRDAGGDA